MIFSLLKINKKISAALAGIAIGAASLWGLSMWQDISTGELLRLLLAVLVMLAVLALVAFCAVALCKLLIAAAIRLVRRLRS
ncbi:MAG: hypothetical protein F4234_00555 [Gammaproteobacteria bacterium]|nr:hypothetical protein [Gammaproteobacteria bacterium]MDE0478253.1 hypothetical protein [Gammaproteobacteria bacterium]MYE98683.1 hypothetical protein [Gammaproteobacteria bacterium]